MAYLLEKHAFFLGFMKIFNIFIIALVIYFLTILIFDIIRSTIDHWKTQEKIQEYKNLIFQKER